MIFLSPFSSTLYKWKKANSIYHPRAPSPAKSRFNDGTWWANYFASSARGAVAEFLRRNPEFFNLESDLEITIELFEIEISVEKEVAEVRDSVGQLQAGISLERLTSSEPDEVVRYLECREFAKIVLLQNLVGIAFPSAAATWAGAWNLVVFEKEILGNWLIAHFVEVNPPSLTNSEVNVLPHD